MHQNLFKLNDARSLDELAMLTKQDQVTSLVKKCQIRFLKNRNLLVITGMGLE